MDLLLASSQSFSLSAGIAPSSKIHGFFGCIATISVSALRQKLYITCESLASAIIDLNHLYPRDTTSSPHTGMIGMLSPGHSDSSIISLPVIILFMTLVPRTVRDCIAVRPRISKKCAIISSSLASSGTATPIDSAHCLASPGR